MSLMSRLKSLLLTFLLLAGMLIGLPLLGVWLAGLAVDAYLEFPPQTRFVQHAPFSWPVFGFHSIFIAITVGALIRRGKQSYSWSRPATPLRRHPFPWWGWAGAAAGGVAWVIAWSRFGWCTSFQPHTFTPLWLAYIVVVSAACCRRTGRSLLTRRPLFFLCLFPTSAAFWWFFEYLNRFTQNWYYVGADFGPWSYFVYATLPFATVLPAVLSTRELVRSFAWVRRAFERMQPLSGFRHPLLPGATLAVAGGGLALIGVWPSFLFPLLWIAPLLIVVSLQSMRHAPHPLQDFIRTDWTEAVSAALSGLICGFFWELWNFYSLAKWKYSIPFVHRFQVFEMPILGYAGYLPFGLECAVIASLLESALTGDQRRRRTD
jgi:hypothetical protein